MNLLGFMKEIAGGHLFIIVGRIPIFVSGSCRLPWENMKNEQTVLMVVTLVLVDVWLAIRIEPSSRTIPVTVSGAARGERKKTGKLKFEKIESRKKNILFFYSYIKFERFLGEKKKT